MFSTLDATRAPPSHFANLNRAEIRKSLSTGPGEVPGGVRKRLRPLASELSQTSSSCCRSGLKSVALRCNEVTTAESRLWSTMYEPSNATGVVRVARAQRAKERRSEVRERLMEFPGGRLWTGLNLCVSFCSIDEEQSTVRLSCVVSFTYTTSGLTAHRHPLEPEWMYLHTIP